MNRQSIKQSALREKYFNRIETTLKAKNVKSFFFFQQHSVAKFTFKMSENGTDYDEEVDIDEEKETETFHVPKVSPQKDSGDVIYDFKKVRQPFTRTCGLIKVYATALLEEERE